jgi:lipoate-protein ligase A
MINVYFSPFKNPFINLAIENYFLRQSDVSVLLFYVNRPCVVMGRFQNPWLETNLKYLTQNDIWLVRRQSGGGAVYHDEGNLNFCFITPGPLTDRKKNSLLIQEAFKKVDIHLEISPRNDLWLNGKKISGSAYKQTKEASFHHGTFLVSSDLLKLEESLKQMLNIKDSKSILSVRSQVTSLQQYYPGFQITDVMEIITHYLQAHLMEIEGELLSHPVIQEHFMQLKSDAWLWGETPMFQLESGRVIKKGIIEETQKLFNREEAQKFLSPLELDHFFPDFSEQHKLSSLIWGPAD